MMSVELARQIDAHLSKSGWYTTRCPAHDDRNPSLNFRDGERAIAFTCHAGCRGGAVATAMARQVGCSPRDFSFSAASRDADILATYPYRDARGHLLYEVVRRPPKRFSQRRPDGAGGWIWNLA